jgi:hypothetical protein
MGIQAVASVAYLCELLYKAVKYFYDKWFK